MNREFYRDMFLALLVFLLLCVFALAIHQINGG